MVESEKCLDKHLPFSETETSPETNILRRLFLRARIKSSWNTNWPDDEKQPGWKPMADG